VLTDRAVEFCRLPEGSRVLDVGCGVGATVNRLREKYRLEAFGLDSSAGLLMEGLHRNPGIPVVQAAACSLPVRDAIFCECVLSLASDRRVVLREFHRTLRPGGRVVLTDLYARSPEHLSALRSLSVRSCLSGAVAKSVLVDDIRDSGFRVLLWEDHSALLKEFAVRLIFAGCSLQSLFGGTCARPVGPGEPPAASKARPGYYLLIAEKAEPEAPRLRG